MTTTVEIALDYEESPDRLATMSTIAGQIGGTLTPDQPADGGSHTWAFAEESHARHFADLMDKMRFTGVELEITITAEDG